MGRSGGSSEALGLSTEVSADPQTQGGERTRRRKARGREGTIKAHSVDSGRAEP